MQSEAEQKEFIKLYGAILKVTNILSSFDEFKDEELINERDKQDYHSIYIELYNEFRNRAKQEKTDVTEDDVQYEIDSLIDDNSTEKQIKDRAATIGDAVNIDYVGSIDGVEFEGGSTQGAGTEITLGNSGYIAGFDDQIVGHTPGDAFDVKAKFPDDYSNKDLAGKDAVFATTLNYIAVTEKPKYDDVLVASATDYKTTKEFEEATKKHLEEENAESDLSSNKSTVLQKVIEASSVSELPEAEVNTRIQSMVDNVTQAAESNGIDLATYLSYYGYDEEGFKNQVKTSVEDYIKQKMIVSAIAEAENISVTDEEIEAKKQELMDQTGITDIETLKSTYGYEDSDFGYDVLYTKVVDMIFESAVEVEATNTDADESKDGGMVDDYGTTEE